ncbi:MULTISPECIES: hypothetical protein [Methylomonas]|nr:MULTISPECIES: hypothetical protein [Methylomonas]
MKTKEQVHPLVLDAGFACDYKKGGRWAEVREQPTAEAISFWFDFVDSAGWIVVEPEVRIEDVVGSSKVQFAFRSLGTPLNPKEKTEFYALKRCLTERYGAMVTTKNEP